MHADRLCQLHAIHIRHLHVEYRQVEAGMVQHAQGFRSGRSHLRAYTPVCQLMRQNTQVGGIVVDQQQQLQGYSQLQSLCEGLSLRHWTSD